MLNFLLRHSLFHAMIVGLIGFLFYQHFVLGNSKAPDVVFEGGNYPTLSFAHGSTECGGGQAKHEIMVVERKPREYYLVRENCKNLDNPVLLSETDIFVSQSEPKALEYHHNAFVLHE